MEDEPSKWDGDAPHIELTGEDEAFVVEFVEGYADRLVDGVGVDEFHENARRGLRLYKDQRNGHGYRLSSHAFLALYLTTSRMIAKGQPTQQESSEGNAEVFDGVYLQELIDKLLGNERIVVLRGEGKPGRPATEIQVTHKPEKDFAKLLMALNDRALEPRDLQAAAWSGWKNAIKKYDPGKAGPEGFRNWALSCMKSAILREINEQGLPRLTPDHLRKSARKPKRADSQRTIGWSERLHHRANVGKDEYHPHPQALAAFLEYALCLVDDATAYTIRLRYNLDGNAEKIDRSGLRSYDEMAAMMKVERASASQATWRAMERLRKCRGHLRRQATDFWIDLEAFFQPSSWCGARRDDRRRRQSTVQGTGDDSYDLYTEMEKWKNTCR